jgi:DNA-binding CsgD family transcriptional regulator
MEKTLSGWVKKGYLVFLILHSLLLFYLTLGFFKTKNPQIINTIEFLSDWLIIFSFYSGIAFIVYRTRGIKDPDKQMGIRIFGYIFFVCQTMFILTTNYTLKLLLSFAYILPPLLYLNRFLKKYFREHSPIMENEEKTQQIFFKYNISEREQELIYLICKGKTNKEISDTLFISLQTVKHHIHSIYKKLKIKNRVQLTNFFRNLKE